MSLPARNPQRGEIWFTNFPSDPPEKGCRPVVVVSTNARNNHPRAETVLVIPLSTSVHKDQMPTHLVLEPGQTGLAERVIARAEDISVIRKSSLAPPRERIRGLMERQVCELAELIEMAMGCLPK
jgi:mRNA-degrading endonuclease toxin of MazEF toxin-antitoxin module